MIEMYQVEVRTGVTFVALRNYKLEDKFLART